MLGGPSEQSIRSTTRIQAAKSMGNTLRGSPRMRMTMLIVYDWIMCVLFLYSGTLLLLWVIFALRAKITHKGAGIHPNSQLPPPNSQAASPTCPAGAAGGAKAARCARLTA